MLGAYQANQIGENEVAQPPNLGHLTLCTCHTRADHDIGVILKCAAHSWGKYSGG